MEGVLAAHWGIDGPIHALARGHTNASFAVGERFVLRRSWAGKPRERALREERVLDAVGAPRIVPTLRGERHVASGGCIVHLFERCRGEVGPAYLAENDREAMRSAMSELARLHRTLASVDHVTEGATAWTFVKERFDRVRGGALDAESARLLSRIERVLADAPPIAGDVQWLHGDYHLGNLLFAEGRVSAIVDFDDTACGSPFAEAAMALFALARRDDEDRFAWDAELYADGAQAYGAAIDIGPEMFCAYQVLVHLEAAQRGWWRLGPGIGFNPCARLLG